jgi:protein-S-isoprenylcysteine O-methyltransferase Ste14
MTDQVTPCTKPSRLPSLGKRGEGWVAIQVVLIVVIVVAGLFGPRWPEAARVWLWIVAAAIGLAGLALFAGGSQRLGRQLTPFPKPVADGEVKRDGAYGLVRHPIYGGVLLLALAWSLAASPLALVPWVLACAFLDLKRRREEAWLCSHDAGYAGYMVAVRHRFIPYLW